MTTKLLHCALLLAGLAAAASGHAQAGSYQFVDLGSGSVSGFNDQGQVIGRTAGGATIWNGTTPTLLDNPVWSSATAINNAGQVVGWAVSPTTFATAPVAWNGTTQTTLPIGSATNGTAAAINDVGQVVGSLNGQATIWSNGVPASLTMGIGTTNITASAINNAGLVVGSVQPTGGVTSAAMWNGAGNGTLLGSLGGWSMANAVNGSGVIAGEATNSSGTTYAAEWKNGAVTPMTLIGRSDDALAINNAGVAVGYGIDNTGYVFAALWNGSTAVNLNNYLPASMRQAGWGLENAIGINNMGWIIGDAYNNLTGASEAYELQVLNPVPEADTWGMMLAGLGLIGVCRYRKRLPSVTA